MNVGAIKSAGLPIIWVLGGPGCGKGTQCLEIKAKKDYEHLASGDLLRNEVMSGSPRGLQLYKLMESGEAVPTVVVLDLVAEAMVKAVYGGKAKGFVMDGFPLDCEQATLFEANIMPATKILFLRVDEEIGQERLTKRQNFDDTDDAIKKRIANFNEKTLPIFQKFANKVVQIDANRAPEEMFPDTLAAL